MSCQAEGKAEDSVVGKVAAEVEAMEEVGSVEAKEAAARVEETEVGDWVAVEVREKEAKEVEGKEAEEAGEEEMVVELEEAKVEEKEEVGAVEAKEEVGAVEAKEEVGDWVAVEAKETVGDLVAVEEMAEEGMPACCKIQYTDQDRHCHHTNRQCNRRGIVDRPSECHRRTLPSRANCASSFGELLHWDHRSPNTGRRTYD